MQTSTLTVLACLIATAAAARLEYYPVVGSAYESVYDTPAHDTSLRLKRDPSIHDLKKKLLIGTALGIAAAEVGIIGALGLKAAKLGAIGAVGGVAGALAAKKVGSPHHHPKTRIEIHSWCGHCHHY